MIPGIVASGAGSAGPPPIDLTEPWGEVARQDSISSGRLVISGLNLANIKVMILHVTGLTVTDDDSTVGLRLIIAGSEISANYHYAHIYRDSAAGTQTEGSGSTSEIPLTTIDATLGVGNASTEGFQAEITIFNPASITQYKRVAVRSSYLNPAGSVGGISVGGGQLDNLGVITGVVVQASSDITAGELTMLGVE